MQQWIIFFSNQGWFPWGTHQLLLEMTEILSFSYLLYIPTQSYSNFIFFYTNYFRIFLFRIWIGKDDWGGLWIRVREVHNIEWYQVYMATEYGPEKYINIHIWQDKILSDYAGKKPYRRIRCARKGCGKCLFCYRLHPESFLDSLGCSARSSFTKTLATLWCARNIQSEARSSDSRVVPVKV